MRSLQTPLCSAEGSELTVMEHVAPCDRSGFARSRDGATAASLLREVVEWGYNVRNSVKTAAEDGRRFLESDTVRARKIPATNHLGHAPGRSTATSTSANFGILQRMSCVCGREVVLQATTGVCHSLSDSPLWSNHGGAAR